MPLVICKSNWFPNRQSRPQPTTSTATATTATLYCVQVGYYWYSRALNHCNFHVAVTAPCSKNGWAAKLSEGKADMTGTWTRIVRQTAMIMANQTMTHKTIVLENWRRAGERPDDWPFGWNGWQEQDNDTIIIIMLGATSLGAEGVGMCIAQKEVQHLFELQKCQKIFRLKSLSRGCPQLLAK